MLKCPNREIPMPELVPVSAMLLSDEERVAKEEESEEEVSYGLTAEASQKDNEKEVDEEETTEDNSESEKEEKDDREKGGLLGATLGQSEGGSGRLTTWMVFGLALAALAGTLYYIFNGKKETVRI